MSGQTYFLNGNAVANGNNCYSLTPNQAWQNGTVWYAQQINLSEPFALEFYMNFGSADAAGADGMVFVLQTVGTSAIGDAGGGMGFQGFNPSFGIEFDTFENPDVGDLAADHVAFLRNGNVIHNNANNLAGPVQASSTSANVEDGQNHIVKISWTPATQTMQLSFDCVVRLTAQINLVNTIFAGNPNVYWGFTGATGGMFNQQSVCLGDYLINENNPDPICAGTSLQIAASGNPLGTFSWSPAAGLSNPNIQNPVASPSSTTTYTCTYTDLCDQQFISEVQVEVVDFPLIDAGADTSFCEGEAVQLNASSSDADIIISWSTPDGNILSGANVLNPTVNESGTYNLFVTSSVGGCSASDQLLVSEVANPVFEPVSPVFLCPEESVVLDAGPNWESVQWNTGEGSATISIFQPGSYSATVSLNGCESSASILVNEVDMPVIDLGPDFEICAGTAAIIDAGVQGIWNTGETSVSITISQAGNYSVLYELQGCTAGDEVIVSAIQPPVFDLGNSRSFCAGDTVFLEIPFEGIWSNGVTGTASFYTAPGIAGVTVVNDVCTVTDQVELILLPDPVLNLGDDVVYCLGAPVTLSALEEENDDYLWSTGEIDPFIDISEAGIYEVMVSNECGSVADSIEVAFEECNFYIYIPNSFTPNSDGINDYWFVYADNLVKFELMIYNRFGQMIYTSKDHTMPWTGDSGNGEHYAQDGVYVYQIKFESETGEAGEKRGTVTLIR